MRIYAIILQTAGGLSWKEVLQEWPVHHVWDGRVAFIQNPDMNDTTQSISEKVGIGKDGVSGLVIQVDHMSGFASTDLVEWWSNNHE